MIGLAFFGGVIFGVLAVLLAQRRAAPKPIEMSEIDWDGDVDFTGFRSMHDRQQVFPLSHVRLVEPISEPIKAQPKPYVRQPSETTYEQEHLIEAYTCPDCGGHGFLVDYEAPLDHDEDDEIECGRCDGDGMLTRYMTGA